MYAQFLTFVQEKSSGNLHSLVSLCFQMPPVNSQNAPALLEMVREMKLSDAAKILEAKEADSEEKMIELISLYDQRRKERRARRRQAPQPEPRQSGGWTRRRFDELVENLSEEDIFDETVVEEDDEEDEVWEGRAGASLVAEAASAFQVLADTALSTRSAILSFGETRENPSQEPLKSTFARSQLKTHELTAALKDLLLYLRH